MSVVAALALLACAATVAATWAGMCLVASRAHTAAPEPYTYGYELWPRQPWRQRDDAATVSSLPTWWLQRIADPGELAAAATHHYRLDGLRDSIVADGIAVPLVLNIDQLGRACLADGHHRLVLAIETATGECPVQLRQVCRIGGYGVAVGPAIAALLTCRAAGSVPNLTR